VLGLTSGDEVEEWITEAISEGLINARIDQERELVIMNSH
jgi:hypothetical protein